MLGIIFWALYGLGIVGAGVGRGERGGSDKDIDIDVCSCLLLPLVGAEWISTLAVSCVLLWKRFKAEVLYCKYYC